jgi:hypothetical protein
LLLGLWCVLHWVSGGYCSTQQPQVLLTLYAFRCTPKATAAASVIYVTPPTNTQQTSQVAQAACGDTEQNACVGLVAALAAAAAEAQQQQQSTLVLLDGTYQMLDPLNSPFKLNIDSLSVTASMESTPSHCSYSRSHTDVAAMAWRFLGFADLMIACC